MFIKTKCCDCGKTIIVNIPKKKIANNILGITCNDCVPADSAARNGIDESFYTEQNFGILNGFVKNFILKERGVVHGF